MRKLLSKARTDVFTALSLARQIVTGNCRAKIGEMLESFEILCQWRDFYKEKKEKEDGSPEELFDAKMKYMQLMDFYDHYQELFFDFEMEINQYIRFRKATGFTDEEKRCFGIFAAEAGKNEYLVSDWNVIIS